MSSSIEFAEARLLSLVTLFSLSFLIWICSTWTKASILIQGNPHWWTGWNRLGGEDSYPHFTFAYMFFLAALSLDDRWKWPVENNTTKDLWWFLTVETSKSVILNEVNFITSDFK